MYLFTLICFSWIVVFFSCSENHAQSVEQDLSFLKISKAKEQITVDGRADELSWQSTQSGSIEHYYGDEKESDIQHTEFKLLWNDSTLFFYIEAEDKYLTARETNRDGMPFLDDCGEIFIIPSSESWPIHFCFEVNLYQSVNDILFVNDLPNNNQTAIKAYNPQYTVAVDIRGTLNDNSDTDRGWAIEMAIPVQALSRASEIEPLKQGAKWRIQVLRQDRNEIEGSRRVTSCFFSVSSKDQDVHQPRDFGLIEFSE